MSALFLPFKEIMIYLDNASTSFPKAPGVAEYVKNFIETSCFNVNRASYGAALHAEETVFDTRELLAEFFGAKDGRNVVFTGGVTQAINTAVFGLIKSGDGVVTSVMEHNAVLRPLSSLAASGAAVDYINCDGGVMNLADAEEKISRRPKAVVLTHASNVCGSVNPISEIGRMCRENGALFIVDCAQTGGVIDIDVVRDNIDALCFAGHKGLMALQGIGGMVLSERAARLMKPLIHGGTGSFSHLTSMPDVLPDKFEAGTLNLPGIASLKASLAFLKASGIGNIRRHENALRAAFEDALKGVDGIRLAGTANPERCAVTSVDFVNIDNGEAAYILDTRYDIKVRSGLHCAPLAHKALGTFPQGTVRFSFGFFNTADDVAAAVTAIKEMTSA